MSPGAVILILLNLMYLQTEFSPRLPAVQKYNTSFVSRDQHCAVKCFRSDVCVLVSLVLFKRGQIWGGDQSPEWQTEGGKFLSAQLNVATSSGWSVSFFVFCFFFLPFCWFAFVCSGWNPCGICREDSGQAGEDHRWPRRYACFQSRCISVGGLS